MDGISAFATVVSVLATAGQVISYVKAVKGAGVERQKLLAELVRTRGLLSTLKDVGDAVQDDDWSMALQSSSSPDGPLLEFQVLLEEIVTEMAIVKAPKKIEASTGADSKSRSSRLLSRYQRKSGSGSSSSAAQGKGPNDTDEPAPFHDKNMQYTIGIKISGAIQDLKWPFSQARQQELLAKLERIKTHFLVVLTADNVRLSKLIQEQLQIIDVKVDDIQDDTKAMREYQEGSKKWTLEQQRLFQSISSLELSKTIPDDQLERIKQGASWLLLNDTFRRWHTDGGTLLLIGNAGDGKTTILRYVEKYLQSFGASDASDVFVVAVSFKYFNVERGVRSLQAVLASIVEQMLRMRPQFQKYYNKLMLTGQGPLEVADSLRIIHRARQDFQHFYIMLDALDEYLPDQAQALVETLTSLRSPPRMFATSRPGPWSQYFSNTINISEARTIPDFKAFVRGALRQRASGNLAREFARDPAEFEQVVEKFVAVSEGLTLAAEVLVHHFTIKAGDALTCRGIIERLDEIESNKRTIAEGKMTGLVC